MIKIAPSILSANFSRLGQDIRKLDEAGADLIHIDVMDGSFVPNISFGPLVVKDIRSETKLPFDVHLMINNPDNFIDAFADAGADIITVHLEACTHLHRTIQKIKQRGIKAAVSLNPATSLSELEYILEELDMVLLMTVNPGFGGQSYIHSVTRKITDLRKMVMSRGLDLDIEIDGGVSVDNIDMVTAAGANVIVSGSAIFNSPGMKAYISTMKERAREFSIAKL